MDMLDRMLSFMEATYSGWLSNALTIATALFGMLAVLELAWFGAQTVLKKGELSDLFGGVILKVAALGFFFTVIQQADSWIPLIQQSFEQTGQQISGSSLPTTPSALIDRGIRIAAQIWATDTSGYFWEVSDNLANAILLALTALTIIVSFVIIALQLFVVKAEMLVVMVAGALMLGFSGSRWTMNFAEKYFGYAVSTGGKLLVIFVLAGFGTEFANSLDTMATNVSGASKFAVSDMLSILGSSGVFAVMSFMIPSLAGSALSGAASLSLSNTASAASGMLSNAASGAATVASPVARVSSMALGRAAAAFAPASAVGAVAGVGRGPAGAGGFGSVGGAVRAFGGGAAAGGAGGGVDRGAGVQAAVGAGKQERASADPGGASARGGGADAGGAPGFADPRVARGGAGGAGGNAGGAGAGTTGAGDEIDPKAAQPGGGRLRDYREEEAEKKRDMRARASSGKLSRMLLKAADKTSAASDEMSAFAKRRRRMMPGDGHTGAAPGIRLGLGD
jgi:type IV secretion system protein TrbL